MSPIHAAEVEDFSAKLMPGDDSPPSVLFEGRAEALAKEVLGPFLVEVDKRLVVLKPAHVNVDFRRLTFMNSSCFKDFVVWLSNVRGRAAGEQYRLRFLSNPKVRWQRASLSSLSCFAVDLVEIVES